MIVDEDAVGLVDQREEGLALHRLLVPPAPGLAEHRAEHVVLPLADPPQQEPIAKEVEAELLGRAVGDVGGVRLAALRPLHLGLNDPHA